MNPGLPPPSPSTPKKLTNHPHIQERQDSRIQHNPSKERKLKSNLPRTTPGGGLGDPLALPGFLPASSLASLCILILRELGNLCHCQLEPVDTMGKPRGRGAAPGRREPSPSLVEIEWGVGEGKPAYLPQLILSQQHPR